VSAKAEDNNLKPAYTIVLIKTFRLSPFCS